MKYIKKPVTVEAVQWTGNNVEEIARFVGENGFLNLCGFWTIKTLEGYLRASEGDYIIKGVAGEFYPCKEDIFKQTYDVAEGTVIVVETGELTIAQRLIDAENTKAIIQNVVEHLAEAGNGAMAGSLLYAVEVIDNAPTVGLVKHGKWIMDFLSGYRRKHYKCSICRKRSANASFYCPACGAKMDGE